MSQQQMTNEEDILDVSDLLIPEEELVAPVVQGRQSFMQMLDRDKEVYLVPDSITGGMKYLDDSSCGDLNKLALSLYPLLPKEALLKEDIAITSKEKARFLNNIITLRMRLSKPCIQTDPKQDIQGK